MGVNNDQKSSASFTNFGKISSLRSTLSSSRDSSKKSKDGRFSQSLCPLLYYGVSSSSQSCSKEELANKSPDSDLPPEYYQKAYYFEENDSDDQSVSDISPLIRRPAPAGSSTPHTHIVTGYLSVVEVLLLIIYAASLVGLTVNQHNAKCPNTSDKYNRVAYFCMIHVLVWAIIGIMDRVVQWRHQVLRRKGYLKFYRKMRNVRRIPFIIVSLINSVILLFVSLLYIFNVTECTSVKGLHSVDFLYIIVGMELLLTLPCLIFYVVKATLFNCASQPPDVIQDTYSGSTSPTTSVTAVGFRDGEDLDELLERQADMIRYLQQHNANLGRRILELQSQTME